MQSSEALRGSRALLVILAVAAGASLAILMWMAVSQSGRSVSLPPVSNTVPVSASRSGMGDIRAVDIVNSAPAEMVKPEAVQASGSSHNTGMGDLKMLEARAGIVSAAAMTVGMGDVRIDRVPAGHPELRAHPGMGDVHAIE